MEQRLFFRPRANFDFHMAKNAERIDDLLKNNQGDGKNNSYFARGNYIYVI